MPRSTRPHLPQTHRLLLQADLRPWQGQRFQPTGFPDLGAAEFSTSQNTTSLLVESVQSMANRLEAAVWDPLQQRPILADLPYVHHQHPQHGRLTSMTEAHRLASPYLFPLWQPRLVQELGGPPRGEWDLQRLAATLLKWDPGSLLHGVFFINLKPVARLTRALSAFIEARDVSVVLSGGVKLDQANPSGPAEQGKGHVPYPVSEYTSDQITAYFNLDLLRLRSYGLSAPAVEMLFDLSLLKIRRFLDQGLRLRSACDFQALDLRATHPQDFPLPQESALTARLEKSLARLREDGQLASPLEL